MSAKMSAIGDDAVEDHQDTGTVRTQFNQETIHPSMAIIATLAEVMDADPVDLGPLHATVEPDALDALVRVRDCTTGEVHVSFTQEDYAITVSNYGVVTITPGEDSTPEQSERWAER